MAALNVLPYMGNIWWRKILANHAFKSFWRISNSQCICHICFPCIWILVRKILVNVAKFTNFFPTKIFPYTVYCRLCASSFSDSKQRRNINYREDPLLKSVFKNSLRCFLKWILSLHSLIKLWMAVTKS